MDSMRSKREEDRDVKVQTGRLSCYPQQRFRPEKQRFMIRIGRCPISARHDVKKSTDPAYRSPLPQLLVLTKVKGAVLCHGPATTSSTFFFLLLTQREHRNGQAKQPHAHTSRSLSDCLRGPGPISCAIESARIVPY